MHGTPPIHHEYRIQSFDIVHPCSSTVRKIIEMNPKFILGESLLFQYQNEKISLSPSFKELLQLLVDLNELDDKALTATSFVELNQILQQPKGGLVRKAGIERWQVEDNATRLQHKQKLQEIFKRLGFVTERSIQDPLTVNFCIVFGGKVERMEQRILETAKYLQGNLFVKEKLLLLGSNRKLVADELESIRAKIGDSEEWQRVFSNDDLATEGNALRFLWEYYVPVERQMQDKLITVNSTRIGPSYGFSAGVRPTTETTIEDCLQYYNLTQPTSFFAFIEQPYVRLLDQQRFTIITNKKRASIEEVLQRLENGSFIYAVSEASFQPEVSVILDEIARNVFRINETLQFIEGA